MRLTIVGMVLALIVLGVSLAGCVSEELEHEDQAQQDEPMRPDFLDSGVVNDGADLAKEFDALPDATPKKAKRKISKVGQ